MDQGASSRVAIQFNEYSIKCVAGGRPDAPYDGAASPCDRQFPDAVDVHVFHE
jgi:hypothetical protein